MSLRYPAGLINGSPVTAAYPSGVWTPSQTNVYNSQNVWQYDQYWRNTTLLLHGDGTNGAQNNTFLDSSSNNFSITRNGNTTQGAFTPYQQNGYWSNQFSSSRLTMSSNAAFALSGDFTIECWIFPTAAWSSDNIVFYVGTTNGLLLGYRPGGFGIRQVDVADILLVTAPAINTWTHVAVVRSGSTMTIYFNGVAQGTATNSTSFAQGAAYIGSESGGGSAYSGYVSNLRITKSAVYASAFLPNNTPLTAITNTSFLTCQSNRFIDNSTNAIAISTGGTPSVQAFQPFPGATTWSASVLGGSGYFDGSGDYLSLSDDTALNFGTGTFTVEFWAYCPANAEQRIIMFANNSRTVSLDGNGGLYVYDGDVRIAGSSNPNSWNHFAAVRSSGTLNMYVNGVSVYSAADTSNWVNNATLRIANDNNNNKYFSGYLVDLRVVKGTAVYTGNFTPPTAPLTAITNTSLLCNFTNAGIFDNAQMNNLETVGNAQISTSVVKYGTGSMAFDGSGDYIVTPLTASPLFNLGAGPYTLEFWVNPNALTAEARMVTVEVPSSTTVGVIMGGGGAGGSSSDIQVNQFGAGTRISAASVLSAGTWIHVAVTYNGTTSTLWVNGISRGTYTGSVYPSSNCYITIGGSVNYSNSTFNGYIDDLRITKGVARYVTSFTPPIARMPNQ